MEPILISIIIPAYNVEDHIHRTLNSLLQQEDKEFETIIVNDGSTDKTMTVLERKLSENPLWKFKIINKVNGGVSSARNKGIDEASGEYLFFLDADDYISPSMVSSVKSAILKGRSDVIAWQYKNVREDQTKITDYSEMVELTSFSYEITGVDALNRILFGKTLKIWTGSAIYKHTLLKNLNIRFSEGSVNGEDQEFIYKALSKAKSFHFIENTLSYYVQRDGSITNSFNIKKFDAILAMDRAADFILDTMGPEGLNIANFIRINKSVESYIVNYISFGKYRLDQNKILKNLDFHSLENEIESLYPGMPRAMKSKFKKIKNVDIKTWVRYKIFTISPLAYYKFVYSRHAEKK